MPGVKERAGVELHRGAKLDVAPQDLVGSHDEERSCAAPGRRNGEGAAGRDAGGDVHIAALRESQRDQGQGKSSQKGRFRKSHREFPEL